MLKTLILDLGNVLVFHDNALLFRKLSERCGKSGEQVFATLAGPLWDATNLGHLTAKEMFERITQGLGFETTYEAFELLWSCHFSPNRPMLEKLDSLSKRFKLVLLS